MKGFLFCFLAMLVFTLKLWNPKKVSCFGLENIVENEYDTEKNENKL